MSTIQEINAAAQQLVNATSRLIVQEEAEQTVPLGSVAVPQEQLDTLGAAIAAANDHVTGLLDPSNPATTQGTPAAPAATETTPVASDTAPTDATAPDTAQGAPAGDSSSPPA